MSIATESIHLALSLNSKKERTEKLLAGKEKSKRRGKRTDMKRRENEEILCRRKVALSACDLDIRNDYILAY